MSQEQKEAEKLIGQVLANTYRLEQLLVSGGMGAVFRARHIRTGGLCAVKVLHSRSAANQDISERFQDEARIISGLRHPSIVQVTDLDQDTSGLAFIVMELLEGEDLQDRLERDTKIPLPEALEIVRQVSSALHAAHIKGVIHRDLKPRNIFLARSEQDGKITTTAKVIDFGVSKIPRSADRATRDLLVLGTPRYMAPEGALGKNSEIDPRSDQWSVAVILYRLLSGKLPFDQENIIDLFKQVVNDEPTPIEVLVPGLPPHLAATIKRALSKKKEDRFPTMLEFVQGLEPPKKRKRGQGLDGGAQQPSLRRLITFSLVGAGLAGLLLIPLVRKEFGQRKRGVQAVDLLSQADVALDEGRGVLYVSNFTANRVEVMSLSDGAVQTSINVGAQPSSLALSADGRYLVVAHFGTFQQGGSNNGLTVIDLSNNSRQTFVLGSAPLGVAFGIDNRALVVTSTEFLRFDPATGNSEVLSTVSGITTTRPPRSWVWPEHRSRVLPTSASSTRSCSRFSARPGSRPAASARTTRPWWWKVNRCAPSCSCRRWATPTPASGPRRPTARRCWKAAPRWGPARRCWRSAWRSCARRSVC